MDIIAIIIFIVLSWVAAGLVNYLADVLPTKRSLAIPVCSNCGQPFYLVYYILWPAKCTSCGKRVGFRHWAVRLSVILLGLLIWVNRDGRTVALLPGLVVLLYFVLVSIIDIEHRLILHPVSLFGAILGAIIGFSLHGALSTLLGGITGFLCMFGMYLFGTVFVKWLARVRATSVGEDALGFGDVTLGGVLGLFLGFPGVFFSIALAILAAGAVSLVYVLIMMIRRGYRSNLTIPYGPFLVFGAFILLFLRDLLFSSLGW